MLLYSIASLGGSAVMVLPHDLELSLDAPKSNLASASSLYSFTGQAGSEHNKLTFMGFQPWET
jgi:hypothetical protein